MLDMSGGGCLKAVFSTLARWWSHENAGLHITVDSEQYHILRSDCRFMAGKEIFGWNIRYFKVCYVLSGIINQNYNDHIAICCKEYGIYHYGIDCEQRLSRIQFLDRRCKCQRDANSDDIQMQLHHNINRFLYSFHRSRRRSLAVAPRGGAYHA